jgi:hypothetical protein
MVCRWLLIFILCSARTLQAQIVGTGTPPDSSVNVIRALYDKGAYIDAEVEARRFLEQRGLPDTSRIGAEQYLAFALVAQGKSNAAVMHFSAILDADSTFDLDPLDTSPKILAALNEAKQIRRAQVKRSVVDSTPLVQAPRRTLNSVSWRAAVFPGWEQLHQGRETTGFILLGAGAAAAAAAVGFEVERASARRDYLAATTPIQASARYDTYNRAYKSEVYAIITFAAIYIASEIDAFIDLPHSDAVTLTAGVRGIDLAIRF